MKAYRITSTEYRSNEPSVFILIDGKYFGEISYALRDNFPKNVEHWKTAMCSDAGRFFKIEEVECPQIIFDWMNSIQSKIDENKRWIDKDIDSDICFIRVVSYTACIVEMIKKLKQ